MLAWLFIHNYIKCTKTFSSYLINDNFLESVGQLAIHNPAQRFVQWFLCFLALDDAWKSIQVQKTILKNIFMDSTLEGAGDNYNLPLPNDMRTIFQEKGEGLFSKGCCSEK